MPTTAAHLRIHNWIMTVRDHFESNFAYPAATSIISNGNAVDMENAGGTPFAVGLEVYWASFVDTGGYVRFQFRVWTRANDRDDPDSSLCARVMDVIRELWRNTGGYIDLGDYTDVVDPGDTPAALSTRLLILRPDKVGWGEAENAVLVREANHWRGDLFYRFAVVESYLNIDHR